jgi:hypothetical protein
MNYISITTRHYGNLWFGHMEVLCHLFTYPFFYHISTACERPPRACIRCPCSLHRPNRTMTRIPSCECPSARIKTAKDHAQTPQCSRTRAFEVRTSCAGTIDRQCPAPPVQKLRPGIAVLSPVERCAAEFDELVHHAPLRAIARKALRGTRERAELLGASRRQGGIWAPACHLYRWPCSRLWQVAKHRLLLLPVQQWPPRSRGAKEHLEADR